MTLRAAVTFYFPAEKKRFNRYIVHKAGCWVTRARVPGLEARKVLLLLGCRGFDFPRYLAFALVATYILQPSKGLRLGRYVEVHLLEGELAVGFTENGAVKGWRSRKQGAIDRWRRGVQSRCGIIRHNRLAFAIWQESSAKCLRQRPMHLPPKTSLVHVGQNILIPWVMDCHHSSIKDKDAFDNS